MLFLRIFFISNSRIHLIREHALCYNQTMELGKVYKKTNSTSYALGASLTYELLSSKVEYTRHVYFHPDFKKSEMYEEFVSLCVHNKVPYSENEKIFRRLSDKEKCLVIGEFEKFVSPVNICENHLVLHHISNMGNLGTILRTALGFHQKDIVIIKPACDIYDPKVIRASMGAFFHVNFSMYDSFEDYQKEIRDGREFYCFRLNASEDLRKIEKRDKYSLVFGNESSGLPAEFDSIGKGIKIPISEEIDSLSLPIAVSIGLYDFRE